MENKKKMEVKYFLKEIFIRKNIFHIRDKMMTLAVTPSILPIRIKPHEMQTDLKSFGCIGAISGWAQGYFITGADVDSPVDIDVDQGHDCPERTGIQST
jgi:hypothetical protein